MEYALSSPLLFILSAVFVLAIYILDYVYAPKHHQNEPPVVPHPIPYVGHMLGLLQHGTRYYEKTSSKSKLPIYTLNILNGKVYVITSPDLVNSIHRNSKKIAFNPFIAMLGKRITGLDETTSQIVQHNLNVENGPGYVIEMHDGIVPALAPGKALEEMTKAFLLEVSVYSKALEKTNEINLFKWTRHVVTTCSTRAVYGPQNPFNTHPNLVKLFWQFDNDLNLLIADTIPSIIAPKGYRARDKLATTFQDYFENYNPRTSESSAMIQARYSANMRHGLTPLNQGRLEVGTLLGILANTIPSIFYMLVHIYSDPQLTSDIRAELSSAGFAGSPAALAQNPRLLKLPESCPLLYSTWQEVLRVHELGPSSRFVLEDTMLENRYLLREGAVVQIPLSVLHHDVEAWGPRAEEFQPRRFMKKHDARSSERKAARESAYSKQNFSCYRPFGGGASLCPGRHFVTLETMALAACMLSVFDLRPVGGRWVVPKQRQESVATNVFPPERDVRVKVTGNGGV